MPLAATALSVFDRGRALSAHFSHGQVCDALEALSDQTWTGRRSVGRFLKCANVLSTSVDQVPLRYRAAAAHKLPPW